MRPLAAEIRCDLSFATSAEIELAQQVIKHAVTMIIAHGGVTQPIPDRGIMGYWADPQSGTEHAARAGCAIAARYRPAESSAGAAGISAEKLTFGIGVVLEDLVGDSLQRAFRMASFAHPWRTFFSRKAYERVVERFDFCGLQPVVPKSEPLCPVYELLAPKPERSGTHHVGPESVPLMGRRELLEALESCRVQAVEGQGVIARLVGNPGQGKSKLIREWLSACAQAGRLCGWTQLSCNGVPYGDYPLRSWERLVRPLIQPSQESTCEGPAVEKICNVLNAEPRPVLVIADDFHWIDALSQRNILQLVSAIKPLLAIVAYRPSFAFASKAPQVPALTYHHFQLGPLSDNELARLISVSAENCNVTLQAGAVHEIVWKAHGNPLYAEAAVAHLAAMDRLPAGPLPSSLVDLLTIRAEWTASVLLPRIRGHYREFLFSGRDKQALINELECVEEQLSGWLDRFDVIEEESAQAVQRFLEGLQRVDGELAILSLLVGKQRPHRNRLEQALARVNTFLHPTEERGSPTADLT